MFQYIELNSKQNLMEKLDEQDIFLLTKVKHENKHIIKNIIAEYDISHSLDPIFKLYKGNYEALQKSLLDFFQKRYEDLLYLSKDL